MSVAPLHEQDHIRQRRWFILGVMSLSLVMVVMAVSSLNVALPTMQRDLDASASTLQWIIDAYALVFAGLLLTGGALGDRFGRKGALLTGLSLFAGGALLSGIATSVGVIIATSLAIMLFRRRLFSLPRPMLGFVSLLHLARILGVMLLSAAMWHLLLPQVALATWVMLATLRLLVSRLPLIPNKELVFAGLALMLAGRDAATAEAMTLIASLFLVTHLAVGVALDHIGHAHWR